jgi:hypothetical protein
MKFYYHFRRTDLTFEERTGEADAFSAAIGRVVLNFSELESRLTVALSKIHGLDEETGQILTCEISFNDKVDMLASTVRHRGEKMTFYNESVDAIDMFSELATLCLKAKELRDQVMHSSWTYLSDRKSRRRRVTAKAMEGLYVDEEDVDANYLLDIADFVCNVTWDVDEFFYDLNEPAKLETDARKTNFPSFCCI